MLVRYNACGILATLLLVSLCVRATDTQQQKAFSEAWDHFANGDFSAAEEMVDHALDKGVEDTHLKARYLYLKGHIQGKKLHGGQASIDAMTEASRLFEEMGNTNAVFTTNSGLAKLFLDQERVAEAAVLLEENIILGETNKFALGYPIHLMSMLAFMRQDLAEALAYSIASYKAYLERDDLRGMANARAEIGFYLMLNGYWEEGQRQTLLAQDLIRKTGDMNKLFYSMVNLVLYQRCFNGNAADGLIHIVSASADRDQDQDLQDALDYATNFDCTTVNIYGGDGDPPPIPPPYH